MIEGNSMDKQLSAFDKINLVRAFDDNLICIGEKLILLVIATHLGDNDFAWLSLSTLMIECCQGRTTLSNNINKLIKKGYLIKIKPSEGYRSNRLQINFQRLASTVSVLVSKQYPTSTETVLDQYQNSTPLVSNQYPNRKINTIEKKIKRKRASRPIKRSLSKAQKIKSKEEVENYQPCGGCQRPKKHCNCSGAKERMSPEVRSLWETTLNNLKVSQ